MASGRRKQPRAERREHSEGPNGGPGERPSGKDLDAPGTTESSHKRGKGEVVSRWMGRLRAAIGRKRTFAWLVPLVAWSGRLVVLATLVGLAGGFVAFMIEMEDRQAERVFRAWQVVATAGPISRTEVGSTGLMVGSGNSNAGRALEYLNRQFSGWGCHRIVNNLARLTTGDERRECILPRKRRESLAGLQLSNMHLEGVWLPNARMKLTQLKGSFLEGANLREAQLTCANFASTMLVRIDFEGATLKRVRLRSANLEEARLNNTDLRGADLVVTHLRATNLDGAQMGCLPTAAGIRVCTDVRGATALTCEQLRGARNWESAYRDDAMQCGGKMPIPGEAELRDTTGEGETGRQNAGKKQRLVVWEHDSCPYERVHPRKKVSVQRDG